MGSHTSRNSSEATSRKTEDLYTASKAGDLDKVNQLLEEKAQANYRFTIRRGKTALHTASIHGHYDVVERLLKHGVPADTFDIYGWSPLYYACRSGHANICELLINNGARLTGTTTWYNDTPLHIACICGEVESVKILIAKGAKIDAMTNNRNTPLHLACANGHKDIVQVLLEKGADCNIINLRGHKPHGLAREKGYGVIQCLVQEARKKILVEDEPEEECANINSTCSPAEIAIDSLFDKYFQGGVVHIKSVKCVFSGAPRVGKTVFLQRLLGDIENLASEGNKPNKSTGYTKPIVVPLEEPCNASQEVKVIQCTGLRKMSLTDEGGMFIKQVSKHDPPSLSPSGKSHSSWTSSNSSESDLRLPPDLERALPPENHERSKAIVPHDDESTKAFFKEVFLEKGIDGIEKLEETTMLYLIDTGGQPEFHELFPLILQGPAMHLIFFNVSESLDQPVTIEYRKQDGHPHSIRYKTSFTSLQMMNQLLSSLYSANQMESDNSDSDNSEIVAGCSKAYILGTYVDQLNGDKEKIICEKSERLRNEFKDAEFYKRGFLVGDKHTIFLPVDNMNGKTDELDQIKSNHLLYTIKESFTTQKIPYSWLLLHLMLRYKYAEPNGYCTMEECNEVAFKCGVDPDHVPQVLQYIHKNLGTILHYAKVDGLKDLVICDPNILFHMITNLIIMAFGGESEKIHSSAEEIRKTGIITSENIKNAIVHDPTKVLKTQHLLNLLIHYNTMREIEPGNYFTPCLLVPDHKMDKIIEEEIKTLTISPLLIQFADGYIPTGVFSALVVHLSRKWKLYGKTQHRNCVTFLHNFLQVMLLVRPTFFEIRVLKGEDIDTKDLASLCTTIYHIIEESMEEILQSHLLGSKIKTSMGVYCPHSFDEGVAPHVSTFEDGKRLSLCSMNKQAVALSLRDMMWLSKKKHDTTIPTLLDIIRCNLSERIGDKGIEFAMLLLKDDYGELMNSLSTEYRGNNSKMLYDVFTKWYQGRGRERSWATIIECLRDVSLNSLADDIEKFSSDSQN